MARYYNPDTGVFLTLDPVRGDIMNPITMNGYNYANSNPVMNVDPDGEYWKNAFWNKKWVVVSTINLMIFTIVGGSSALVAKALKKYAENKLTDAKGRLFAEKLKKNLMRKGFSALAASYVLKTFSIVVGWASFYFSPGETIFKELEKRDKYPNNGYFNGY